MRALKFGAPTTDILNMQATNTTFLRSRDPITGARGADILRMIATSTWSTERMLPWIEAARRLSLPVAAGCGRDVPPAKTPAKTGGVYRAYSPKAGGTYRAAK